MTDEILGKFYYDASTGFLSAQKLYLKLKEEGIKIPLEKVREFVSKQLNYQLLKTFRKPKHFNTINSTKIRENFQLDIIIYNRFEFNKFKYILCIIDVYSRFVQAAALTNREIPTIMTAIEKIFKVMGYPININCDNEFNTETFNKFAQKHDIIVHYCQPDEINKNAIVERFNRTLAMLLQKWRIGTKQYNWQKVLPDIIKNYNNTYHSTVKNTPQKIWDGKATNMQTRVYLLPTFSIGDQVRLKKKKKVFAKGDAIVYSKNIYIVTKINGDKIYVKNLLTNENLKSHYKPYELIKVSEIQTLPNTNNDEYEQHKEIKSKNKHSKIDREEGIDKSNILVEKRVKETPKEDEYEIEKIVDQQKGIDGKMLYRIHWKGYPSSNDTWQNYKDIKNTTAYENWIKN